MMLADKHKVLVCLSISSGVLGVNIRNTEFDVSASASRQGWSFDEPLPFHFENGVEGDGTRNSQRKTLNLRSDDPCHSGNQILKLSDAVIKDAEEADNTNPGGGQDNRHVVWEAGRANSNQESEAVADVQDVTGKKNYSNFFGTLENCLYNYQKVTPTLHDDKLLRGGFYKSTCFRNPMKGEEPNEYCIFINPAINHGQGLVIVTSTRTFEDAFDKGLEILSNPPDHGSIRVVPMPDKGGAGAVAARKIQFGDYVEQTIPVALFPYEEPIWKTPVGQSIRRQAIDHLPPKTRAAVARLAGSGETEDEFISNLVNANTFDSYLHEDIPIVLGALYLKAPRLNHSCRPNVDYYVDFKTQLMHMVAVDSIPVGEELTISYFYLESDLEARKKLQDFYGIHCTCSHCLKSPELREISDQRLQQIPKLIMRSEGPDFHEEDMEKLFRFCEQEKVPKYSATAHFIAAKFYNSQHNMQKVKEHAEKARDMGIIFRGQGWSCLDELEILISKPEKHSSYFENK
ncbi:hypothetical protein Pst134EA_024679 [Puccinia striiformis f. sp. tritici]|uniref:SET domain-containing protein n=4 Tax=Puccinia striiformis TaxID=27350 RepID=A0A0L0VMB8_9BASI|nr:hypothetical protein Pst134EA_024679 [Puccinia striiformis f. sp. tritici]KNF00401.1 hypothetical protein PSTG_06329 [Puccinia striiformis f. sp. tritici PST-78]POV97916.1 hypothetical protein PSHT_14322 [Puccinia striiformis]KAH9445083.1 hypothetical protein Pst134EB_025334 [Puccinia striiformis f. sp. tritici]KAH9453813.1 hypothetical protein Pst134EA_024679 [Puccinia striiformis f. sp. tritici]POW02515.1 hypothetical protein PSTT_11762 [Puccinia striiformis]